MGLLAKPVSWLKLSQRDNQVFNDSLCTVYCKTLLCICIGDIRGKSVNPIVS